VALDTPTGQQIEPRTAGPGIRCPKCRKAMRVWMTRHLGAKVLRVRVCACGHRIRTEEKMTVANDRGRAPAATT
jgi:hypothetical protein